MKIGELFDKLLPKIPDETVAASDRDPTCTKKDWEQLVKMASEIESAVGRLLNQNIELKKDRDDLAALCQRLIDSQNALNIEFIAIRDENNMLRSALASLSAPGGIN